MEMNQARRRRVGWLALARMLAGASAQAESCKPKGVLPADAIVASWYGAEHHGHRTANGTIFDEHRLTAAHPSLPLNTHVRVTNLANGRTVDVTITDRGPAQGRRASQGRGIDLSEGAAEAIKMLQCGLATVIVTAGR